MSADQGGDGVGVQHLLQLTAEDPIEPLEDAVRVVEGRAVDDQVGLGSRRYLEM
jgi:hypothetical protein